MKRNDRWFWVVGILLSSLGVALGIYAFNTETWYSRRTLTPYRDRAAAAGFTTIMVFGLGLSIRNLILSFKEKPNTFDDFR